MRVVVVGAGAWGLPAAAELAGRGHHVTALDARGPGNRLGSSSGPTRIWRLAHPDPVRVRLAVRAVEAWRRLESRAGHEVLLRRGLLWRDAGSAAEVAAALAQAGIAHEALDAADVGRFLPGLRPNGIEAVWQPEAGPLLAAAALQAQRDRLESAGGEILGGRALGVEDEGSGLAVVTDDARLLPCDAVVLAAGPWTTPLLDVLGIDLPLAPVLEQVCYVGGAADERLPCWFEGPRGDEPGLYAMATPGRGYKVGIDRPLRAFDPGDERREPSDALAEQVAARIRRDLPGVSPAVTGCDVCTWTYAPDGRFVVDRVLDGRIVLACGDSGEGFKFSALLGEVLADLVEGGPVDEDVATWSLDRFGGAPPEPGPLPTLGL